MLKRLVISAIAALAALAAAAQNDAQFSQYYEIPNLYNPAAIGLTDNIRLRGAGRLQWLGIDGAPRTFLFAGDMPFKLFNRRFGTGLVLQQETIGLYSSLNLNAQIAYKLRKFGGEFTGALQIGMYDQRFKGSEVYLPDGDDYHQSGDEAIPTTDLHGTALDLGAGIFFNRKTWYAGISMTHLTAPAIKMGGENGGAGNDENIYEFHAPRTLYFTAGGNIPLKNTLFEVMPSLLAKTDFSFWSAEATIAPDTTDSCHSASDTAGTTPLSQQSPPKSKTSTSATPSTTRHRPSTPPPPAATKSSSDTPSSSTSAKKTATDTAAYA